jgi:hypothetical protein
MVALLSLSSQLLSRSGFSGGVRNNRVHEFQAQEAATPLCDHSQRPRDGEGAKLCIEFELKGDDMLACLNDSLIFFGIEVRLPPGVDLSEECLIARMQGSALRLEVRTGKITLFVCAQSIERPYEFAYIGAESAFR